MIDYENATHRTIDLIIKVTHKYLDSLSIVNVPSYESYVLYYNTTRRLVILHNHFAFHANMAPMPFMGEYIS